MATILGIKEETLSESSSRRCATGFAAVYITEWNHAHNGFAARAVTELAFVGITILGVLETLASSIYILIVKGASVFVSNKNEFEKLVVMPSKIYTASSFLFTNTAIVSLIENLKNRQFGDKPFVKVMNFYRKV